MIEISDGGAIISKNLERKNDALVNENIKAERVLAINAEGQALGEMDLQEAIRLASEQNLDLVCVAPNAKVPVCRFIDYSKYRYDMQRKSREAKKNQKVVTIKEVRLTPVIGNNDFETKLKNGREFLNSGNKLKVTLYYPKGKKRMIQFESSKLVLDRFVNALDEISTIEGRTAVEGKNMSVILAPKNKKKDKEWKLYAKNENS